VVWLLIRLVLVIFQLLGWIGMFGSRFCFFLIFGGFEFWVFLGVGGCGFLGI